MNETVRQFTALSARITYAARVSAPTRGQDAFANSLATLLREARVYDVPRDVAANLYAEVQRHVGAVIIGVNMPNVPAEPGTPADLRSLQFPVVVESLSGTLADLEVYPDPSAPSAAAPRAQAYLNADKLHRAIREGRAKAHIPTVDGGLITAGDAEVRLSEAREALPVPGPLPFPAVFIGFGAGLRYDRGEASIRADILRTTYGAVGVTPTWRPVRCIGVGLFRQLVTADGGPEPAVIEFVEHDTGAVDICPHYCGDVGWMPILGSAVPWWTHALMDLINDVGRSRVIPATALSYGVRRARSKLCDDLGLKPHDLPPPAPYYEVKLIDRDTARQRVAKSVEEHTPVEVQWSHRWDVRAHDRMLVRRGPAPMRQGSADLLRGRGYTVFEPDLGDILAGKRQVLPPEEATALTVRGHDQPTLGEWIAIRHGRVREHVRGPENAPYVPATRVVAS